MKRQFLNLILIFLTLSVSFTGTCQIPFEKLEIKNLKNKIINLKSVIKKKPYVLIFLSPDCPISQKYIITLNELVKINPSINIFGIFTKWDKLKSIRAFKNKFKPTFNLYSDTKGELVKTVKAETTPEVFFYDANDSLLYAGAIDNWYISLGENRQAATEFYLAAAINSFKLNEKIKIPFTKSIGCIIEN